MAGTMIGSLAFFYYFRLIAEPVASVFRVMGRQRTYLVLHGAFLLLRAATVLWATLTKADVLSAITVYAGANTIGYLLQIMLIRQAIRQTAPVAVPTNAPRAE